MPAISNAVDRLVSFTNSQGSHAQGTLLHITRGQIVFEVYNPYSIVQLSEVLNAVTIMRAGTPIYKGKAVVSSLVNTGLMLVVSATLVDTWSDVALQLARSNDLRAEVAQFVDEWQRSTRVRPGYQVAVGQFRSFLAQLSPWLDQIDIASDDSVERVPTEVFEQIREGLLPRVAIIQQQFEHEARLVPEDELEAHRAYAQRDLLPLMMKAPFFYRSRVKPLGYAGDYQMVKMMVEGTREGATSYARLVNDFYLEIDLVKAHRNRLTILEQTLSDLARKAATDGRTITILNVGCGPAIELVRFIKNCPQSECCHFRLIDFNAETIDYARSAIDEAKREARRHLQVEFTQRSVHELLKASASKRVPLEREYDFVYCAGLFDYLSDRICARLLELFCDWTKPGGVVMATNVHPDNPTRLIMEHVVEWTLIHRTMKDMEKLSPPPYPFRVFDDATHMNVFLEIAVDGGTA